jgi:26S proteasome regulatory subunit N6
VVSIKSILNDFPKAKAAKILKILIELNENNSKTRDLSIRLCQYLIDWCNSEKRTYLKHRIEIKLANLFWHQEKYQQALEITSRILEEVRRADDKHLLVETELVLFIYQRCNVKYFIRWKVMPNPKVVSLLRGPVPIVFSAL